MAKTKAPQKQKYLMTPEEFSQFKTACNPGKAMILGGPMPLSAEERAIVFWAKMAQRHRFDPNTVEPSQEKGDTHGHFFAVPLPEETEHAKPLH
jgi:hypothetical protein